MFFEVNLEGIEAIVFDHDELFDKIFDIKFDEYLDHFYSLDIEDDYC